MLRLSKGSLRNTRKARNTISHVLHNLLHQKVCEIFYMFNYNDYDYYFSQLGNSVLEILIGMERKKTVTSRTFHSLEGSMTFLSLNCTAGHRWWKGKFELPGVIFTFLVRFHIHHQATFVIRLFTSYF